MKVFAFIGILLGSFAFPSTSAREYYTELREAGGLNKYSDQWACFPDDETGNFTVLAKVEDIIVAMRNNHDPIADTYDGLKKDLIVRYYSHGVASPTHVFEPEEKDASKFRAEFDKPMHVIAEYSFNWTTGRYRFHLSVVGVDAETEGYGKCELIHPK